MPVISATRFQCWSRVLRQNGRFVLISLGPPGHRLEFLESSVYPFAILVYGIAKPGWDPYDTDASTSEDEDSCRFVGPFDVEDPAQYEVRYTLSISLSEF